MCQNFAPLKENIDSRMKVLSAMLSKSLKMGISSPVMQAFSYILLLANGACCLGSLSISSVGIRNTFVLLLLKSTFSPNGLAYLVDWIVLNAGLDRHKTKRSRR